tara:strand:+ start:64 stop:486 length:423 start_codon:yes stop_codon:yes gene_type:complete
MSATGPRNGNTGADAGFFISEEEKKRKANESGYATDYQGDLNPIKKNKTKTKNQQNLAEHERMMRENRGGNQVVQSPTASEVSQVTQTEVTTPEIDTPKEDDITIRKRKAKARGRSPTILTGVTGVTGGLTLGKPSLLGR